MLPPFCCCRRHNQNYLVLWIKLNYVWCACADNMLVIKTTLVVIVSYWAAAVNCDLSLGHDNTMTSGQYDAVVRVAVAADSGIRVRQCAERVTSVEMCRGVVSYNVTGWPNLIGHQSLIDAETQLRTFAPLVQYGCAKHHLAFFLCAVYVPMCNEKVPDVIGPCRPLCERVRQRCQPLLQNFGFPWPAAFNCSRFPAWNDHTHMCMDGPPVFDDDDDDDDVDNMKHGSWSQTYKAVVAFNRNSATAKPETDRSDDDDNTQRSATSSTDNDCLLIQNKTTCGAPCVWLTTWNREVGAVVAAIAVVCLASTVFCTLTYVIDTRRSDYSERVIVFMAICCGVYAAAVLVGVLLNQPTSLCRSADPTPPTSDCVALFVLLSYFSLSCATWWVVLNVVCMLTSALRWSDGDVRQLTTWFHVVAWTVPAVLVVVLLVGKHVELDVASGLCLVNRGTLSQMSLVITALLVYLVVGVTLSVVALVRSRDRRQNCVQQSPKSSSSSSSSSSLSVRLWVVSAAGTTVLIVYTGTITYDFVVHQYNAGDSVAVQTPVAATAVRIVCPLLMGVVTVPWMMSGQASASWRTWMRRQLAKCCTDKSSTSCSVSTLTHITSHQHAHAHAHACHVNNTARYLRHQMNDQYHHQQRLMRQHITRHDFCTACYAHHHHHHHHRQQQHRHFYRAAWNADAV